MHSRRRRLEPPFPFFEEVRKMVVCLVGKTELKEQFDKVAKLFALQGFVVLRPELYPGAVAEDATMAEEKKQALVNAESDKIDLCDFVVVIGGQKSLSDASVAHGVSLAQNLHKPVLTTLSIDTNYGFPHVNGMKKEETA